jgi:hypothetical protein
MISVPALKEHWEFCRNVLDYLRTRDVAAFEKMADAVEHEFGFPEADIKAEDLGAIDTFRFEVSRLFCHANSWLGRKSNLFPLPRKLVRRQVEFWNWD